MIKFVPEADSFSGCLLALLGRVLGLRSETVDSRAILLLTLLLFLVGGLVIAGFWIFLFRQFDAAERQELRGTALQVRQYLEEGVRPGDIRQIGALVGRQLTVKPVSTERAAALQVQFQGLMLERSPSGVPSASFLLPDPDGPGRLEATLRGTHPLGETAAVAARVFLVALSVTVGVMLLLLLIIVDRTILRRIQLLADKLEHEKKSERLPVQLNYPGDDELAQLARSIEELALLVQAGEREYRHVVKDQTESICRFDAAWRLTFYNRAFEALAVPPPGAPSRGPADPARPVHRRPDRCPAQVHGGRALPGQPHDAVHAPGGESRRRRDLVPQHAPGELRRSGRLHRRPVGRI